VLFVAQSVVHALPPTISFSVPSTVTVKGSQWEALPNGNGGWNQTYLSIGVHLSAQENVTATVEYASSNGTAVAGVNFIGTQGSFIHFNPGQVDQTILIPLIR